MPTSPGKSTVSTAVAVPPLPRTSAATATCDRGATAARDPPYGRALAVPRSLAEVAGTPEAIVVRRRHATRRTGERWRYHDRWRRVAGVLGAGAAATWNALSLIHI